ncbi:hypothetical protein T4D_6646 [Trichinella pseudospiralis]|uniref:Uncharacterized protein n=1 Tax=Trichinella pseudospiralis TaxID=6337 RepID=A0A0V1F7G5_TRIPS|nr:hypothetical protein T4D_6646 [Trichinella pseudospiralis]
MNVFIGLLSVAGIFHENHKNPGNYGVSIKLQEERCFGLDKTFACIMVMLTCGQLSYGGFIRELGMHYLFIENMFLYMLQISN